MIDSDDMVDDDHPVIDMTTVDIDQYLPEAQPYILKAIEGKALVHTYFG